ncbi:outer membrane beta-barrel protein [Mucilaginibacter terrae]|uniref:Outer membrane protein beta-barrel domain-containing protein n=1 Tax=Mucilaginibacter terrae TaxID=1955052 RepID=A0ABU3GQ86_9SPHI|nr:outer membrane beta-barrel protein [Mucilaginibacter terrae]MDT3401926.1 hypothetical protein [Mucilaginibacter terrae]
MLRRFLFIAFLFLAHAGFAQQARTVSGIVKDTTGAALPGSTVKLIMANDSVTSVTNATGAFSFANIKATAFTLHITSIGFQGIRNQYNGGESALGTFTLKNESTLLGAVVVNAVIPVKIKGDTTEFSASAYKVRDGAPAEDMLRKLPGVDVDKSGNVTAQGKSVTKVRVNGKDFFGGDLKTATQNLPANIIQNMQLIDDYGDQANLTGVKTGEPEKILNITIRPDKNYGYFGQATLGDGSDAQNALVGNGEANRYVASGSLFSFNGDRQIAGLANFNNTNSSLFSFGSGGPRGGGPGGGGGRQGGANTTASSDGITIARSLGLNYRDQWGKKISAYGSYSFSDNTVNTLSSTTQTNISTTSPSVNSLSNNQTDGRINHRFNFNIEYKIDTMNYLKFIPSFSYAGVNTDLSQTSSLVRNGSVANDYSLLSTLNSSAPNVGGNVLYNHKFNNKGRNFSINASAGSTRLTQTQNPVYNYTAGTASAPLDQLISTRVKLDSVGTTLSYLEPLSKRSFLELNYAYHYAHTTSDKSTDTLTTAGTRNRYSLLSNDYEFNFITNRVGLNYRFIESKYNYTLGLAVQPSLLTGNSPSTRVNTRISTLNFAPTARFIYNASRSQSFSFNYNGASNQPTYSTLQPVIDFSNALYPTQGNADLKPEFNNNVSLRYNKFDFQSGNVFFTNLSFTKTDNKIVANTINYPTTYTPNSKLAGTILTQYLNADGFYSAQGGYSFAKPWQQRRYTLMFNGNVSYNNNISYISNVAPTTYAMTTQKNIGKSLTFTQGTKFRTDITDIIDAELNASYSITKTNNSLTQNNINNNFRTFALGLTGKNYFGPTWTLSYDFTRSMYYGYTGSTNPNILNTYIEKKFLKQNVGSLRLSAFDLFNQNTGFSNTATSSYVTETQSNRLGRYFLLTFTLRLQNFAGGKRPTPPRDGGGQPPFGGMGGLGSMN